MAGDMFGRDDNGGAVSGVECLVLRRVTFWGRRQAIVVRVLVRSS